MDLFNKVHVFEPEKSHIYEPNISLISLLSLMFNYAKPRMFTSFIFDSKNIVEIFYYPLLVICII